MVLTDSPRASRTRREPGGRPRQGVRAAWVGAVIALLAAGVAAIAWSATGAGAPGPPPASVGLAENRALPASVLDAPLVDGNGRSASLASFAGRVVVLVPFLTSCQEVCPLTTGALLKVQRSLDTAGLGPRVAVVEVTVDPGRDVPGRLAAYSRLTGVRWPLLTGAPATLAALWHALGIYAEQVPEGSPPGVDWQTGKPYAYDVDHSDGFIVLDARAHERFVTAAAPDVRGVHLPRALAAMLDAQGRLNRAHPGGGAWTVPQALQAVGWLIGRPVAPVG